MSIMLVAIKNPSKPICPVLQRKSWIISQGHKTRITQKIHWILMAITRGHVLQIQSNWAEVRTTERLCHLSLSCKRLHKRESGVSVLTAAHGWIRGWDMGFAFGPFEQNFFGFKVLPTLWWKIRPYREKNGKHKDLHCESKKVNQFSKPSFFGIYKCSPQTKTNHAMLFCTFGAPKAFSR